ESPIKIDRSGYLGYTSIRENQKNCLIKRRIYMKETANRAYEEMRKAALERLRIGDAREIAGLAGVTLVEETASLRILSLGRELRLSWTDCTFQPPVEGWQHLILLHYLDLADGTPLTGKWINFGSLREGVIRGTKFDRDAERDLGNFLKGKTPEQVRE